MNKDDIKALLLKQSTATASAAQPANPPADAGSQASDSPDDLPPEEEGTEQESVDTDGDPAETDPDEIDLEPADDDEGEPVEERKSRAQKRVLAEIAKRKAAEERLKELQQENEQLKASPALAGTERVYASQDEIDARRVELRQQIRKVEAAIRKGEFTTPDGEVLTVEDLEEIKANLEDERDLNLPKAEKLLRRRQEVERDIVAKHYPQLLDRTSPEAKEAEALLRSLPGLRAHPEARLLIGDLLRGRKLRLAGAKAKPTGKPAPARTPPAEPTGGTAPRSGSHAPSPNSDKALMNKVLSIVSRR